MNDPRFEKIELPQDKVRKNTKNDRINDLLGVQLSRLEQVLSEQGIVVYNRTIQGTYLDAENIIEIKITEDNITEQSDLNERKSKSKLKVRSIVPSLPFTQETVSRLASESLSKLFVDLMGVIRNKKIMSEILGIEPTEDENELFKSFFVQYYDLWLPTDERRKELLNKFQEKSILVLNRYSNKHN
ncbi:hypothetical protein [Paenibacillus sp. PDC88]|uniref:hypothetical protein n=1 Tax=Paenibacillus sp. PDC88 TaxID=1884375 RepID=UPI00115FA9A4|nr:hypothetical protein [Paenibacillus sp. PDC88]